MTPVDYSEIPAPGQKCIVCDQELVTVPKHPTVLNLGKEGAAERRDVCPDCWEKMAEKDFFSFWLTQREPPKPDTRLTRVQQRAALLRLFEQFHGSGDARFRSHVYVLAHLLMKWRLLAWEGTETGEDGVERIVFRNRETDDKIAIEEVALSDESLVSIKREIDIALAVESQTSAENDERREAGEHGGESGQE